MVLGRSAVAGCGILPSRVTTDCFRSAPVTELSRMSLPCACYSCFPRLCYWVLVLPKFWRTSATVWTLWKIPIFIPAPLTLSDFPVSRALSSAVLQWVPVASGVQARTPFVFVWCVNLSLCFATDVSAWKARFAVGYLVLPNGVPLVYWLEKACSTYPRPTGSTSTSHCMTRAAPRQSAISFGSPCP